MFVGTQTSGMDHPIVVVNIVIRVFFVCFCFLISPDDTKAHLEYF